MKGGGIDEVRQETAGEVAWHIGDLLRARQPSFERLVDRALGTIAEAAEKGSVGISFSGGKDSTVLLNLVRSVVPHAPAGLWDSGVEMRWSYEMAKHYGVELIKPRMSLVEMCKFGGYWGYPTPTDPEATFDFGKVIIDEPSAAFAEKHNLTVHAIGLRMQESQSRRLTGWQRGELYFCKYDQMWHLCPLMRWAADDVWAYVASRKLRYNRAYDIMTALGIPRDRQRIGPALGASAAALGRYAYLRQIDPDLFNRLAADFPKIRRYT